MLLWAYAIVLPRDRPTGWERPRRVERPPAWSSVVPPPSLSMAPFDRDDDRRRWRRRDGRRDTTTMATTMAADDDYNKVDGDGATGEDDGTGATGDDNDDDDDGDDDDDDGDGR